jgi:hypothetical protein
MNRPLEPTRLTDPAPRSPAGNIHPAPPPGPAKPAAEIGKVHPAPVPLTFGQTFWAVFWAILAAVFVIWVVGSIYISIQKANRLNEDVRRLLHDR